MAVSEQRTHALERGESSPMRLQQHGVQAPIHQLPPEILATIFKDVAQDGHYDSYFDRLLLLPKVCQFWNEIVNSTPELWSMISLTSDAAMIERALVTSKYSLIDLVAIFRSQGWVLEEPLGRILHVVLNDTPHRWRSATFDVPKVQVMVKIFEALNQASFLQRLHLKLYDSLLIGGLPKGIPLVFRPGPNLQALSIDMGLLRFSESSFNSLRSLRLTALPFRIAHSSKEWLGVLRACPALVELHISKNADIPPSDVLGYSQHILLRSLATLVLQCNMRLTTVILESLSVPSCRRLRVDIIPTDSNTYDRAQLDRELQRHVTAFAHLVASTAEQEVVIRTTPVGFCLGPSTTSSSDATPCLEINLLYGELDHPLLLLETVFDQETLGSRLIRILLIDNTQVSMSDIHSTVLNQWTYATFKCITTWPRLGSISCSMPPALIEDLLACLAPRHAVDPPCHDLKELIIDVLDVPRHVVDLPCHVLEELIVDGPDVYHHSPLPVSALVEFLLNRRGSNGTGPQRPETSSLRCIRVLGNPGWSEAERRSLDHTLEKLDNPLHEFEVSRVRLSKNDLIQSRPALALQPSENLDWVRRNDVFPPPF